MDLKFTEAQEILRKMVRDFLATECPKTMVRELEQSEKGYSPELWEKMAELIPTTSPAVLSSGPLLFPGLMEASV